jgi:hypothetical protein
MVSGWLHTPASSAISKVHLLNKRLGGPLEIVAKGKSLLLQGIKSWSSITEAVIFANCVCRCCGFTGAVEVLGFEVIYVSEFFMLLNVTFGLDW